MHHVLFELLQNAGFLKGSVVDMGRIGRAKRSEMVSIAQQSAELTPTSGVGNCDSLFTHAASLSLGGGPTPCAGRECRMKQARELAQFAALYSDRVFLNNHFGTLGRYLNNSIDEARLEFHDDLEVMLLFRPLIEAGLIVPITPTTTHCYHCLGRKALSGGERKRFDSSLRRFKVRFETETEAALQYEADGLIGLSIKGSDELLAHGSAYRDWGSLTQLAKDAPQLAKRLKNSRSVPLSKVQRKKFSVDTQMAHELFNDIGFEMAVSQCLKTSIVTGRQVDVEILKQFSKNDELNQRNSLMQKHLTCMVPFLNDISVHELLVLREAQGDAFISFRHAFAKAVDEHVKLKAGNLTARDAEAIFKDVIEPELARLNLKMNTARRSVLRGFRTGIMGWVAAISVGHYFGFPEAGLVAIASALGLPSVTASLFGKLTKSSCEDSIRNENMYFLWKVQHSAQRS